MATAQRKQAPATPKAEGSRPAAQTASASSESIATRAYEIWKASGCPHGKDQEHWFQAERELRVGTARR